MKANRGLTIARMVKLGGVSRSGFYRFDGDRKPAPERDMELRDAIQRIALELAELSGRASQQSYAGAAGQ